MLSKKPLLQETIERFYRQPGYLAPLFLCQREVKGAVTEVANESNITAPWLLTEPSIRETAAPLLAAALLLIKKAPGSLLLSVPADHYIGDTADLNSSISKGVNAASKGKIVLFGAPPSAPSTSYGYIEVGNNYSEPTSEVLTFHEKPSGSKAGEYLEAGNYLWNTGIFLTKPETLIEEAERNAPTLLSTVKEALAIDQNSLDHAVYERAARISIDYAILERSQNCSVVTLGSGWSDMGSWHSLWESGVKGLGESGAIIERFRASHMGVKAIFHEGPSLVELITLSGGATLDFEVATSLRGTVEVVGGEVEITFGDESVTVEKQGRTDLSGGGKYRLKAGAKGATLLLFEGE